MAHAMDIVLINPGDRRQVYQGLGADMAAIEPPYWTAAIAGFLRSKGFAVSLIDANAENYSPDETAQKVRELDPLIAAVIVYGSQPSASTQNMTIAGKICRALKAVSAKVVIGGLHPSALPRRTMEELHVDFLVEGEGPYTFEALLNMLKKGGDDFSSVPGLWYFSSAEILHTPRAPLIEDIDSIFSDAAWDLLPMKTYRAHNWHCFDDIENRSPYAAVYTSLGCPYGCVFCCINSVFGKPGIRYRSPAAVIREIGMLSEKYGVKNLKIIDELFILNEKHYMSIVDGLIEKGYPLNIWAYARIDTVQPGNLARMKKAGINWLALGIESANANVREDASKNMRVKDIAAVIRTIREAGIRVGANFIFGLPEDTRETMQETLDMARELNCEYANFYCAMAYPGSRLYDIALKEGWALPGAWHGFSQHSFETLPLPTKHISAREVLKFRDEAFHDYFENPAYLDMIEKTFSGAVKEHIKRMTVTRLKRRIVDETRFS